MMKKLLKYCIYRFLGFPNYLRRLQWPYVSKLLALEGVGALIDLGAGPMHYSIKLAKSSNFSVIAVDLDFPVEHVDVAKKNGVNPLRANGQKLPFGDQTIDRILMSSLLHMVPDPNALLIECKRVLKKEGHIVLSVPNNYQFIPRLLKSPIARLFNLPEDDESLIAYLNKSFYVGGPRGYYSVSDLTDLFSQTGLEMIDHEYAPGRFGSLLWEVGVLAYVRFGNVAFHLLFFFYPFAKLIDAICNKNRIGSEHIVKIRRVVDE